MRTWVPGGTAALSALLLLASPSAVHASFTSVVSGNTATMTGDAASDTLVITESGGQFRHNRFGDPGFASDADFDTATAGVQTVTTGGVININAGDGDDTISVGDFLSLKGTIDGGLGADTLDYSAFTAQAVSVNLGLGTTGLNAAYSADQEVPPTTHAGTGTGAVTNYNVGTRTFDLSIAVSGLPAADVTGFHIHYGWVGVNGLVIIDLAPLGTLVPSGTGFTFNATGITVPADMEAAFLGGATYLNIHTAAFPNGAIRGQLVPAGNVNLTTGRAFGVASVTGVERAIGGASSDSLVGSFAANTLSGGSGADGMLGGPGSDTMSGGPGEDLMIWSNGDGTDVMEGGDETDFVQVNGSPTADDVFVVSAIGARIDFDRTSPGPFSLDIGTTEQLIVNGHGGADSFTVNDPGSAAFTRLDLFGFDGNDVFTVAPVSAGGRTFTVHGGAGTDTVNGPNGSLNWSLTGPNQGAVGGLLQAFRFIETLNGGTGNDTFNVRAFSTGTPAVAGGAGTDALIYDAEGRSVSGDATPPDGAINSPGVQTLTFTQMESVIFLNVLNTAPTISPIANQTIAANGSTGALAFTIGDVETPVDSLTLSAASSNTTLVPLSAISFGGAGATRTVTVTPAFNQAGTATITITVTDGNGGSSSSAFLLTVTGPTTVQAPVNLYVSALSGNTVTFRFTPSTLGPPATGFVLEGGLNPGEVLASIPTGSALPIYSVLAPNGSFYVRMIATRGTERSAPSNEIRVHVNVAVAPSAPDLFTSAVNGSSLLLSWRNTFGGGAATGLALDVTGAYTLTVPLGLAESFAVTGVPPGSYTLRLRALNAGGSSPATSPVTFAIPSPCPGPPQMPQNVLFYRVGSTAFLVWEPPAGGPAADRYTINVTGSFTGTFQTTTRSASGEVGPGSFTVTLMAVNACGASTSTPPQTIVVP